MRPLPLLAFLGHFLADLALSGAQVAWQALRPGRQRQSAIVRVRLRTDSDLLLTIIAQTVSLVPGSLVLDLDREERLIAIHLLHVRDHEHVELEKAGVLATEDRVVRAFGSAAEIAALGSGRPPAGAVDAVSTFDVVSVIAYALLGGGALLALARLALGPSLLDRVVATDTLLVIISAGPRGLRGAGARPDRRPGAGGGGAAGVRRLGVDRALRGRDAASARRPATAATSACRRRPRSRRDELAVDVLALGCLLAGAFLCLTAGLGLVRFPDVLSRMHAGTKPQVLGVLLVMVGAAIRLHGWSATWMLLLVAVFQMLTAPVSAHMISRVAYRRRHVRRDLLLVDELRDRPRRPGQRLPRRRAGRRTAGRPGEALAEPPGDRGGPQPS